jgi:hypothetical protein
VSPTATGLQRSDRLTSRARWSIDRRIVTNFVTTMRELGELAWAARDCYPSSEEIQSHCETTKFSLCPTGGQVAAGSNPVSPTGISAGQRLFWLIGPQASTITRRCHTLAALVKRFAGVPTHPRPWS